MTGKVTETVPGAGSLWEPVSGPELRAAACRGHHQPNQIVLPQTRAPKAAFLRAKQRCTEWWQAPGQGGNSQTKKAQRNPVRCFVRPEQAWQFAAKPCPYTGSLRPGCWT